MGAVFWVFMQSLYPSLEDPLSTSERKARQISSVFVKQYQGGNRVEGAARAWHRPPLESTLLVLS